MYLLMSGVVELLCNVKLILCLFCNSGTRYTEDLSDNIYVQRNHATCCGASGTEVSSKSRCGEILTLCSSSYLITVLSLPFYSHCNPSDILMMLFQMLQTVYILDNLQFRLFLKSLFLNWFLLDLFAGNNWNSRQGYRSYYTTCDNGQRGW